MSRKKIIFLSLTAGLFFLIGFLLGIPVKDLYTTQINIPAEYISENQQKIDVLEYKMDIELYPEQKLLKGDVHIRGIAVENIPQIDLNFYDNLIIQNLWLNELKPEYINSKTRLTIPVSLISGDTFDIRIVYSGKPVRAGLSAFVFGKLNNKSVIYNINEPTFASTWFPCNDIPSDKALLKINITNDSSMTSVSNGRLTGITSENGRRTFSWETVYPISTYLIAVYSSEYENFSDTYVSLDGKDTMKIEYYAFPDHTEKAKKDFSDHPEMIKIFSEKFGEYPFIKEKYGVAEFLWQIGAMENQTITGIGSNFINGSKYFNDIYVHELAHSWWGNSVGPADWKDIWLNEGFATYSEALYSEYLFGEDALISTMMSKFDENFSGRLYDPGSNLFSSTIYSKGAWVLHMLRWETGDSLFFKILRDYYDSFKYKTASTADFRNVVEKITGKDFKWFFNQWVIIGEDQVNLEYDWSYDKASKNIVFNTNQTQTKFNPYIFTLELEIIYPGRKRNITTVRIDKKENKFTIPSGDIPEKIKIDPKNRMLANYSENNF